MDLIRTLSAIVAGVAGVAISFLAIYLAEYAPPDAKAKTAFLIASAIACTVWIVAVIAFAVADHISKKSDKLRMEETIRDIFRGEKIFDSRNRAIADAVRIGDQLSLLLAENDLETKRRFRRECGEPPWNEGHDPIIKAIMDSENRKAAEEFNQNYLDRVRSIFDSPEGRNYFERNPHLAAVIKNGAKDAGDIHSAFNELDSFSRRLIHGI